VRTSGSPGSKRALAIILSGLLLIAAGVVLAGRGKAATPGFSFPRRVGGLALTGRVQTGQEAAAQIGGLHGLSIPVKDAYVAVYRGSGGEARLWIAGAADDASAADLLTAMDQKMPGNGTFTGRTESPVDGLTVYRVDGAGMVNYYYRLGRRVYWLGYAGVGDSLEVLRGFIGAFSPF
jgi:hypothetical protein